MADNLNPTLIGSLPNINDAASRAILANGMLSRDTVWQEFFSVRESVTRTTQYATMDPAGLYQDKPEGQEYTYSQVGEGPKITHVAKEVQLAYEISSLAWDYMQPRAWAIFLFSLGASAPRTWDRDCMSVFPDGFVVNGPDGVPLWSNSHNFGSNYATTTFGYAALRTLVATGMRRTNDDGNIDSVMYDTLVLPPDKIVEARQIMESELGLDNSGNQKDQKNIVGRMLSRAVATPVFSSTTQWFAVDSTRWDAEIAFRRMPRPTQREAPERGGNQVIEDRMVYHYGHNNAARAGFGFEAAS